MYYVNVRLIEILRLKNSVKKKNKNRVFILIKFHGEIQFNGLYLH